MSRYVDADMLIRKYIDTDIEKFSNSDVKIVLENLKQNILKAPSIEIVRCRECKWFNEKYGSCHAYHWDLNQGLEYAEVDADDFCSYGQKERASDEVLGL